MKRYLVRLPVFEGPFDLLLHLVREHEISILDIPMSRITEEYMAYLSLLEAFDMEVSSEFLVIAATLMHIKSRMLLPQEEGSLADEGEEGDPRMELVRRLLEYKRFKEAAEFLERKEREQRDIFYRSIPLEALVSPPEPGVVPEATLEVSLYDLVAAYRRALRPKDRVADAMEIAREAITIDEKIVDLRGHFGITDSFVLGASLRRHLAKGHFIALFLALLELARLGLVVILQAEPFAEIRAFRIREIPGSINAMSDYR